MREPAYRRALAQVSTPLDAVGEPIEQFIVLPNPPPGAAPADTALQVSGTPKVGADADATWAGVIVANAEAAPAVADAGAGGVRVGGQTIVALPAKVVPPLGPDAVLAADLDYDFRTDLVVASGAGVAFLRQGADGRFTDVTQGHDAAGGDRRCTGPRRVGRRRRHRRRSRRRARAGDRRRPRCCATTAMAPSSRSSPSPACRA